MKVFICMPYGDHLTQVQRITNTYAAMDVWERLASTGVMYPYCQHLTHAFLHERQPRPRDFWITLSGQYLAACDCLLVIGEPTDDMRMEITEARRLGKPVFCGATYEEATAKLGQAYQIDM